MSIQTTKEAIEEAQRRQAYKRGYLQALYDFAWWKDGVQYVGCGVKTLKQAQEDFEKKGEADHATEKTDH